MSSVTRGFRQRHRLGSKELQRFFKTSNYKSHKNNNSKRLPQTCQWFLKHPAFEKWRSSREDDVLWLSAGSGSGKSVLSRALVDEKLVTDSGAPVTICYFFFGGNEEQSSATTALCAIIHQLISQHSGVLWEIKDEPSRGGEGLKNDFDAMWNLFIKAATSIGEVICVLDALEECKPTERESLVEHLESFYTTGQAFTPLERRLKFFITSRPFTEDQPVFPPLVQRIPVIRLTEENELEKVSSEIAIVIGRELQNIVEYLGLDKNAHSSLHNRLKRVPNKTYLWLHLVLAEVRGSLAKTEKELEEVLDALPRTVEAAYETALSRCIGEEAKGRILHIILAAQRPLTLIEVDVALEVDKALRPSDPAPSSLFLESLDGDVEKTRIAVQDACGMFINILDSRIYLSRTAKEFLLREIEKSSGQRRWTNSIDMCNAHRVLSRICVTYLLLPEIQGSSKLHHEKLGRTYALLEYSASQWIHHVQEACDHETNWIRQTLKLCDLGDGSSCYWYKVYFRYNRRCYRPLDSQPKEIWAVVFGLINVLQSFQGSTVDQSSPASSTTQLLGEAPEDSGRGENYVEREDHESTTPNFRAVVERPLDWHALNIPIQALMVLSEQPTAQQVMQIILVNERPGFLVNSMKAAASKGTRGIAVMQLLLLQQGANALITKEIMKVAAESTSVKLMQLLLQQQGATALITEDIIKAAAESKSVVLMQLLLQQQGADVLITEEVIKAAATDLDYSDCREMLLLLLDQPRASDLITEEVWVAVSELRYIERFPLLESILGKVTITEEMTATFVRVFSWESVQILLDQRGADVPITAEVMKAALDNENWSRELTVLLFNQYGREAYEALMLLGKEGRVPFKREEHSFYVKSSAGWVEFPLERTVSEQLEGASVADEVEDIEEADEINEADEMDEANELHDKINELHEAEIMDELHEVHEVHERRRVNSTPSSPRSQIEDLMTPDSSQELQASSPNHTGVPSRFPSMVFLQSIQRSIRKGLSILPWNETPILPGHQRIYWRNHRNKLLYDDYVEHKPGALLALQEYLDTSAYRTKANPVGSHGRAQSNNHASRTPGESSAKGKTPASGDIADQLSQGNPSNATDSHVQAKADIRSDPIETLHLFSCTDKGRYGWQLHREVITNVSNDTQLFEGLRKQYRKHRGGLRPYWSFRTVHSIQFMKVNFWHEHPAPAPEMAASIFSNHEFQLTYGSGNYVDMRFHDELCVQGSPCVCIPPESLALPKGSEYDCDLLPPGQSPPLGPNVLMNYFTDPNAVPLNGRRFLGQVPKKIGGDLTAVAWGIYYKEGWDWVRIGIILFGFILSSGLFGIIWTVAKNDIQGGFTISSWWMTVGASLVSLVALSAPPF